MIIYLVTDCNLQLYTRFYCRTETDNRNRSFYGLWHGAKPQQADLNCVSFINFEISELTKSILIVIVIVVLISLFK
mgnify:CR=1 FL=1